MAAQIPTSTRGWVLQGLGTTKPELNALKWEPKLPLRELGPTDVLVKFQVVSLNFRDVAIIRGVYPLPVYEGVVPGADGAGHVVAVGSRVSRFSVGDNVIPYLFQTGYFGGTSPRAEALGSTTGACSDGSFREHGVFDQEGLVSMPTGLSFEEGSVIQGPFLTAWSCFTGGGVKLRLGDCVLVQGSGVVSIAAIQLAVAAGATVIATTSSEAKAEKLRALGAKHVINYTEDSEWGVTAKKLSPKGVGCRFVIDVIGEPKSFRQSLEAIAAGGEISAVGFLATAATQGQLGPSFFETLLKPCTVRGIQIGSRAQLDEVCHAIEAAGIKPVYDSNVFDLEHLTHAYQFLIDQKNFGKVNIRVA